MGSAARVIEVRRGYVEWDLRDSSAEDFLWEVGVRAALVRRGVVTRRIAALVRGVDVPVAEATSRSKFNVIVYKESVKLISVNPSQPLTRDQVRTAKRYGKIIEVPLRPLLRDLKTLAGWLEVLEPEIAVFSTPVDSPWSVKSPLDVENLLVELSGDPDWRAPIERGLELLVEAAL